MNKKLKTPIKTKDSINNNLIEWVIENFPENYEDLTYIEPMCDNACIFLNKKKSKEEILNDLDYGITSILKSLRDEPKEFVDKVKRVRYTERTFNMAQKRASKQPEDYVEAGVNEYVLRCMSRSGLKKHFLKSNKNGYFLSNKELNLISKRIINTNILNVNAFKIIKNWDEEDSLIYLNPSFIPNEKEKNKDNNEEKMTIDDHIQLLDLVKNARGKVIINGYSSPLYNRNLKEWRTKKKNKIFSKSKMQVLWMNY